MKKIHKILLIALAILALAAGVAIACTACSVQIETIKALESIELDVGETIDVQMEYVANKDNAAAEKVQKAIDKL